MKRVLILSLIFSAIQISAQGCDQRVLEANCAKKYKNRVFACRDNYDLLHKFYRNEKQCQRDDKQVKAKHSTFCALQDVEPCKGWYEQHIELK